MSDPKAEFEFYHYTPSLIGAAIFAGGFYLSSTCHAIQLVRARTWYFVPLLIGGLMEGTGYVGRAVSHYDHDTLVPYLIQTLLLLVAPALYAASIYMILGRLIATIEAEHLSVIRINWLTKIFVAGDVLSFMMQSTGGGIMAKGAANYKLGENIVLGGLFAQITFFGLFMVVIVIFHLRVVKRPTPVSQGSHAWKKLLMALYIASMFILVRSLFRVVEYLQGRDGYLLKNEVWLYVFDSVLMFSVTVLFNVVHPSIAVPGRGKKESSDGFALGAPSETS